MAHIDILYMAIQKKDPITYDELLNLGIKRQQVIWNLRTLLDEGRIQSFNKPNPKQKKKDMGFKDDEIFFTIANNFESPQGIKKTIEKMCMDDTNLSSKAFLDFIKLCESKHFPSSDAKKLAHALMAGVISKEMVSFELINKHIEMRIANTEFRHKSYVDDILERGAILGRFPAPSISEDEVVKSFEKYESR